MNKLSKFLLSFCFLTFTFFAWNSYEAQGKLLGVSTENKRAANVVLPEHAADQAVIALGKSYDQDSQGMVEGYAIIRRNENYAKGGNKGGGKPGGVTSSCYGFLSSGMKWKTQEPWFVNTTNSDGLSELFVRNTMIDSVQKWEAAAGVEILGPGQETTNLLSADLVHTDGVNEVYFAPIDEPGVIGVTIVWGYFSGPPKTREIVEWDQVYDDVDFDWTSDATIETNKMDFEAIATHELGHTMGLGDLYTQDCGEETMYGYGSEGQIHQRSLNTGDITGVRKLYQ